MWYIFIMEYCCSVAKLCPTLCNPMNHSMPGLSVPHHLPEFSQVHALRGLPWYLSWQRICLQCERPGFYPWVGMIPWWRACSSFQYSWLENPHGQRSLEGYSPWVTKSWHEWATKHTAHVHWIGNTIQQSHPLSPSSSAFNLPHKKE